MGISARIRKPTCDWQVRASVKYPSLLVQRRVWWLFVSSPPAGEARGAGRRLFIVIFYNPVHPLIMKFMVQTVCFDPQSFLRITLRRGNKLAPAGWIVSVNNFVLDFQQIMHGKSCPNSDICQR